MGHDGAGLRGVFEKEGHAQSSVSKNSGGWAAGFVASRIWSPFALRQNYPEYWAMLLAWDKESPRTFKPNCTVEDLEQRFSWEDRQMKLTAFI